MEENAVLLYCYNPISLDMYHQHSLHLHDKIEVQLTVEMEYNTWLSIFKYSCSEEER